ncbi:stage III sporulation protein SpoIIIAB [Paenibacillus yanchengensis]|uniref:Stage III sporulation protein SpoIIIAB n=1 Tax=Paenibacillus yanchengensis TaxID=2035833 RepID=A0ABW4YKJ5_9BACL
MMKLLGALLILLAGTLFGFFQANLFMERPKQLRQLIHILQRLATEIGYGQTALPIAIERASKDEQGVVYRLFQMVVEQLQEENDRSFVEIWQSVMEQRWAYTSLKASEQRIVIRLGSVLGISDTTDQLKQLQLAMEQLKMEEEQARDNQAKYATMWRSLGLLIAVFIIILIM